jgi:threonine dehydratase
VSAMADRTVQPASATEPPPVPPLDPLDPLDPTRLMELVQLCDVAAAAVRLAGKVVRTPVLRSAALDRIAGTSLWLKAENLQRGGSYKLRGAMHAVGRVADDGGNRGVIAESTGNHAVAVGLAARKRGIAATLVLSPSVPDIKAAQCRASGARIIMAGATADSRHQVVSELHASSGDVVIDPYDHPDVIAGQGTASLELIEHAARRGTALDALVVPVGGGGGVAGACLAAKDSGIQVYGVEPLGCDALARSLAAGSRVTVPPAPTLADGLTPARPGQLPYQILSGRIAGVRTIGDESLRRAVVLALVHLKVVLEPSGAAGLAAALDGAFAGFRNTGIILTGGNVEPALIARLIGEHAGGDHMARAGHW